jgi:ankyrin repeat protein
MSVSTGESSGNLEQLRKRAKELLKSARAGDAASLACLREVQPASASFKLADAQLAIARGGGFASWPKLVAHLAEAETRAFRDAILGADAAEVRRLLVASARLRKKINQPIFVFGRRPIHAAAKHLPVIDVLLEFGADINLPTNWDAGPFGVLDECPEELAAPLIRRGADLTAHAAARFGWLAELRKIVLANPKVVHAKGGDGQRPLHFAKSCEVVDFLLQRGAEIDARCIDHGSTAAQYALKERPEVARHLLACGATPDIFMAARLGDRELAKQLIDADPECLAARTNFTGYEPVPVLGIYNWTLGFYVSPHQVALEFGHQNVFQLLSGKSSPKIRLLDAAMRGDRAGAEAQVHIDPSIRKQLLPEEHALLAAAAMNNRLVAFKLMLDLGFDPMARGLDGGTALHLASWIGNPEMIDMLLQKGAELDALDSTHGASPLSWATYGSVHRRREGADYAGCIRLLVAAGADIKAPGNRYGSTMLQMGEGNPEIQQVLRELGSR